MKGLSIRRLSKTYVDPYQGRKVLALRDLDLEIAAGEFIAVVGPSGCGKTTLLNLVAGFLTPSGGEILVEKEPVSGPGADRGVVFQSFALFPWMTVLDNVAFGLKMRGVGKHQRERTAIEFLELAGLAYAAERYPNELSGGMQQRVGVARALANHPDILLMDEPFASVDAQTRMTLQDELARIWQQRRTTVLLITHDVSEAVFLADRVVVLSQGSLFAEMRIPIPHPRDWAHMAHDEAFHASTSWVLAKVRSA